MCREYGYVDRTVLTILQNEEMVIASVVRLVFGFIGGRAVSGRSDSPTGLNLKRRICPSGPHVQTTWHKGGKGRLSVSWLPMVSVLSRPGEFRKFPTLESTLSQSRSLGFTINR